MAPDDARWEYRIFDSRLGPFASRLAGEGLEQGRDRTDERYLLSADLECNLKIREGVLEVKRLLARRAGLQRWMPIASAPFPLSRAWIASRLPRLLAGAAPHPARAAYDERAFLLSLTRWAPRVAVVPVSKRRTRWRWRELAAEHVAFEAPGIVCESVAVEGPDAHAVGTAVAELDLVIRPNRSWVEALREMLLRTAAPRGPGDGAGSALAAAGR